MKKITGLLAPLVFVGWTGIANASLITVADWFVDGVDDGSADFRVTEIFTSAADLGGSDNRYVYSFENLTSNLTASLFRMSNPNADPRTSMSGPSSWVERVGSQNFIWETATSTDYVGPGGSLDGLTLFTTAILPALTSPPLNVNAMGWINTRNSSGAFVSVFGAFPRDGSSTVPVTVPVPATLALFGLGLAGLGWSRRKKA